MRSQRSDFEFHIIVVDDGSTDGTAEAIRSDFPDVEIVRGDGELWYTAGTNRGISAALKHEPDFILAINNDQIFDERCIAFMLDCAVRHPRSVIGALILDWETPHKLFQVSPRFELLSGGFRHWYKQTVWTIPKKPWRVELIVGNCVLYPAGAIREVGLMDEKRLVQYGDAEYTPRMRRHGWQLLIEPRARVFCKPNNIVSGFRHHSISQKIKALFFQPTGPYSLRRRISMNMGGAQNRVIGLLAVPIFFARLALGRNIEGSWAMERDEGPLSETFASEIVEDD
jgi:GT2 family glycosyltransferase